LIVLWTIIYSPRVPSLVIFNGIARSTRVFPEIASEKPLSLAFPRASPSIFSLYARRYSWMPDWGIESASGSTDDPRHSCEIPLTGLNLVLWKCLAKEAKRDRCASICRLFFFHVWVRCLFRFYPSTFYGLLIIRYLYLYCSLLMPSLSAQLLQG
jgi:hypothetical protein